MTPEKIIQARIDSWQLDEYRKKVFDMRRIASGDLSPVGIMSEQSSSDRPKDDSQDGTYQIEVKDFAQGRSNEMLRAIKSMLMLATIRHPEFEFTGMPGDYVLLHQLYLEKVMKAEAPLRAVLADTIVSGLGWAGIEIDENGYPSVCRYDPTRVIYDTRSEGLHDIQWVAIDSCKTAFEWAQHYDDADIKRLADESPDQMVKGMYYYDLGGEKGTQAVMIQGRTVYTSENPYYFVETIGEEIIETRFLPVEPMYLYWLPSNKTPIGLVQMMLPHQLAIWASSRAMYSTLVGGKGARVIKSKLLDERSKKAIERDGIIPDILFSNDSTDESPIHDIPPQEVSQTAMIYGKDNEAKIVAMSGENPYSSGSVVDNVNYAREVEAIQGESGLTSAHLTKEFAGLWERVTRKFLAASYLWDDRPIRLVYESLVLEFDGKEDAIKTHLDPMARPIVRDDSTRYKSVEQRQQEALRLWEIAPSLGPTAMQKAGRELLLAFGKDDPEAWLSAPEAAQQGTA